MKYFLIAGEASGDLHAAPLIEAIKQRDPDASFSGFGGDRMAAAGCTLYRHIRDLAFMGFVAVLKNISTIRRNFAVAKQALLDEQPDVLILVDYPSFNLKMAKFARQHLPSLRIVYYIPPKVWAWKRWRRKTILRLCDQVLCIFPFEPSFYNDPKAVYVGNPTAEECLSAQRSFSDSGPTGDSRSCSDSGSSAQRSKIIALLPGSRRSEISHCLPKMLEAARRFPDYEIRIAQAPSIPTEFYEQILSTLNFETTLNSKLSTLNYDLLRTAAVSIVNSGTATLEAALLGCPEVAVYHVACPNLMRLIWKAMFTFPCRSAMFLNLAVTTAASSISVATISPESSSLVAFIRRTSAPVSSLMVRVSRVILGIVTSGRVDSVDAISSTSFGGSLLMFDNFF